MNDAGSRHLIDGRKAELATAMSGTDDAAVQQAIFNFHTEAANAAVYPSVAELKTIVGDAQVQALQTRLGLANEQALEAYIQGPVKTARRAGEATAPAPPAPAAPPTPPTP